MVETITNSFGILEIYNDSLILKGFGNQKDLLLTKYIFLAIMKLEIIYKLFS